MSEESLGKSREDYLEAILMQTRKNGACRLTDVAQQLNFSKPSVSIAVKKLEEEGYVVRDDWKLVLTEPGEKIAERMLEKHRFFTKWLMMAGVDAVTAEEEACRIEHVISDDSFTKVMDFMKSTHGGIVDGMMAE